MKPSILLLLATLLLSGAALADDFELLQGRAKTAENTFVAELTKLASWADENELFGCRNQAYEMLVVYDTENRPARRALRYRRTADGTWERGTYKPPKNHEPDLVPEFERRLAEIRQKFLSEMHAILDASAELPIRQRISLADELLKLEPDDGKARRIRGETKLDGKWVLDETARAVKRREELTDLAQKIIDGVKKPKPVRAREDEKKLGVTWVGFWQGEWWRASGTTDADEVQHALRLLDASHPFFDQVFDIHSAVPKNAAFYLLSGKEEAKTVLENHPLIPESSRSFLLELRAAWVPHQPVFFHWSESVPVRLDGSVRMALGLLILRNFQINTNRGWVWEGLGLYLDYCLTGSHRTIFVTPEMKTTAKRRPPFDIETRMKKPGADWVQLAYDLVTANAQPEVLAMAQKKVNALTPEDLVYSYALVAYIVEGCQPNATRFFSLHGNRQPLDKTVEKVFSIPFDYFMERFHRWLAEIT